MTTKAPYSPGYEPAAPVLPIRVSAPAGGAGVGLVALVDTGADLSVIPKSAAEALALPVVSTTRVQGVIGIAQSTRVFAAAIEVAGTTHLVELVGLGDEAILGRDLMNFFVLKLDGPRGLLEISRPSPPAPTSS